MLASFAAAFASDATPLPIPTMEVDPELVTPGPWGFLVIALLALAVIVLVWDMMRRIRRGRVRADIAEELEAERAALDEQASDAGAVATDQPGDEVRRTD
jgi:hypothetical protein